ncbi:hypothetical protein ACT17_29795 [Mycolicibacterium conceptionense]|uniref:Uncharacterized protein n=1 Tax=Mycolicibacterium conceptionense TaxID=451644 RepID=A0A0J8U1Y4_9MYCO|nr:hypothetical protein ACT17_29795 [Mycolicibacterium conceptionense]
MRQRLHVARRDSQHRIKEASQRDALSLGDELEIAGGCVERAATAGGDAEVVLVLAKHDLLTKST